MKSAPAPRWRETHSQSDTMMSADPACSATLVACVLASGVTASFNLNMLNHLNDVLDAEFDTGTFSHRAFYDTERQRIEMHLVSDLAQTVRCNGSQIQFQAGESIHTENSYKYTMEGFAALAESAGLVLRQSWFDQEQLFSVHYLEMA